MCSCGHVSSEICPSKIVYPHWLRQLSLSALTFAPSHWPSSQEILGQPEHFGDLEKGKLSIHLVWILYIHSYFQEKLNSPCSPDVNGLASGNH